MEESTPLEKLQQRSYNSYLARLSAEKRLRNTSQWWNAAQFVLSASVLCVSIIFMIHPDKQQPFLTIFLVILSVLTLIVSFIVTFLDYSARAKSMFRNYRQLQVFAVKVETISEKKISATALEKLQAEYNTLLDTSENHTSQDFYKSQYEQRKSKLPFQQRLRGVNPYILPFVLIVAAISMVVSAITLAIN